MLELSLHRERGAMVVEDLEALPRSPLVVADGSTLPAAAVADRSRAVWLMPMPEFHDRLLEGKRLERGPRELYLLLAETIEREARENGVPICVVDGTLTVDATVDAVQHLLRRR